MIIGIGLDLIELTRVKRSMAKNIKIIERILTEKEREIFHSFTSESRKIEFLAGRFAAKEAFVKAVGTGISSSYSWHDIEIKNKESGQPYLFVPNYEEKAHLSISHSTQYAVASVIIERLSG